MELLNFTDEQVESDLLESPVPTAIEFWSFRCEACRKMAPIVSHMAKALQGKLIVLKVNVDENPRLVAKYAVSMVPYLLVLRNGHPIASFAEEWSLQQVSDSAKEED